MEKMVHTPKNEYVKLSIDSNNIVYLNGKETGHKIGSDGKIYTIYGAFFSDRPIEEVLKIEGKIKWFPFILIKNLKAKLSGFIFVYLNKFLELMQLKYHLYFKLFNHLQSYQLEKK